MINKHTAPPLTAKERDAFIKRYIDKERAKFKKAQKDYMPSPQDDLDQFEASKILLKLEFDDKVNRKRQLMKKVISETNTKLGPQRCENYLLLKQKMAEVIDGLGIRLENVDT